MAKTKEILYVAVEARATGVLRREDFWGPLLFLWSMGKALTEGILLGTRPGTQAVKVTMEPRVRHRELLQYLGPKVQVQLLLQWCWWLRCNQVQISCGTRVLVPGVCHMTRQGRGGRGNTSAPQHLDDRMQWLFELRVQYQCGPWTKDGGSKSQL